MANPYWINILKKGAKAWNEWRDSNPIVTPDLGGFKSDFFNGLRGDYTPLRSRNDLRSSFSTGGNYGQKFDYSRFNFSEAILNGIDFRNQDLSKVNLKGASLIGCDLENQYLTNMDLQKVNLTEANLKSAKIINTDLSGSCLIGADLRNSIIDDSNLQNCDISQAKVYGAAVWDVNLDNSIQQNIIITKDDQAVLTVDNLKVAQFVYLIINNSEIRNVIDTIASKAVLILGRFTEDRLKILHRIRDSLRTNGYLPILFDFDGPDSRDTTETIMTLAHMSKFIIADLSEPKSVPHELNNIIKELQIPVKPIIASKVNGEEHREYWMFNDLKKYPWVLPIYRYDDEKTLTDGLNENVIKPAVSYQKR